MNKLEREVMKIIYYACNDNKQVSVKALRQATLSETDILRKIKYKRDVNQESLHEIILSLATEDYFECKEIETTYKTKYQFTLLNKGKSFIKEIENEKRAIKFKIILTVSGAILSFIIGLILKAVFQ